MVWSSWTGSSPLPPLELHSFSKPQSYLGFYQPCQNCLMWLNRIKVSLPKFAFLFFPKWYPWGSESETQIVRLKVGSFSGNCAVRIRPVYSVCVFVVPRITDSHHQACKLCNNQTRFTLWSAWQMLTQMLESVFWAKQTFRFNLLKVTQLGIEQAGTTGYNSNVID